MPSDSDASQATAEPEGDLATATQSAPSKQTIGIDPDGDLLLWVGSDLCTVCTPTNMRVCSATMRRASPVWRSMLFGPWSESKPAQGDWVVSLPDDNPQPLQTLLSIVHGNFVDVPRKVEIPQLYDIVVVADKYALLRALQPWAPLWLESVRDLAPNLGGRERLMRAHAAWELGSDDLLSASIRDLVWNVNLASGVDGGFWYLSREPNALLSFDPEEQSGPPDLLGVVTELRLPMIQDMLDFFNRELDSRSDEDNPACRADGWCDTIILGIIWQYFRCQKEDLLPMNAGEYPKAATCLLEHLSNLFTRRMRSIPRLDWGKHDRCPPAPRDKWIKFEVAIKDHERLKSVLLPHHKERLAAQRATIGL
ncbi:hypothetical protein N658DRAFT_451313 [Parathielavia hyrcaniae]|uniref:Uncharacterized protein n=1 Tax=Parathielavia hyrcaniae TaxID=113614 RepID=A0AAN6PZ17_9PEZI|nr:hypothetical protein N658DRAFT_451313 [Parathielavia hyrcaniae]